MVVVQAGAPELPGLSIVTGIGDGRERQPRHNGAPSQLLRVIRRHPETGDDRLDLLQWGLIPHWTKQIKAKPINATAERVATAPMFRAGYAKRRCLIPVDAFFEWRAMKGIKQPYAIGLKTGEPFGLGGIWESWCQPGSDEIVRSFCIITCPANELVSEIHERMPVIIPAAAYDRWLANIEPDPQDLLRPSLPT